MEQDTMRLSAHYAPYFICGDDSHLSAEECLDIDRWMERDQQDRPYDIVDVSEETTFGIDPISGFHTDLAEYTIIYR